jgi:hypothetical protein
VGNAGQPLPLVQDVSTETGIAVRVGDTVVAFNRGKGPMTVGLPWGGTLETDVEVLVACLREGKRQVVTAPAKE